MCHYSLQHKLSNPPAPCLARLRADGGLAEAAAVSSAYPFGNTYRKGETTPAHTKQIRLGALFDDEGWRDGTATSGHIE